MKLLRVCVVLTLVFLLFFPARYGFSITIKPVYVDNPGEGFKNTMALTDRQKQWLSARGNDATTLGELRKNALEHAFSIIEKKIPDQNDSVSVEVSFFLFNSSGGQRTVAQTSRTLLRTTASTVFYTCALAEAINLLPTSSACERFLNAKDMVIKFSRNLNFYYGLDGNPPIILIDFVPIVIHEVFHGLGFASGVKADGSFRLTSSDQTPVKTIYDKQMYSESDDEFFLQLTNDERAEAITSGTELSWDGTSENANPCSWAQKMSELKSSGIDPSGRPLLYAPTTFVGTSSVTHLSKSSGDVMRHSYPFSNNMNLGLAMLQDMGWEIKDSAFPPSCAPTGITTSTPAAGTGGEVTFTVKLDSEPMSNVSIPLTSSDSSEIDISPSNLVFTPTDWSNTQEVTVTASDTNQSTGLQTYAIEFGSIVSSDKFYKKFDPQDVFVRVGASGAPDPVTPITLSIGDVSAAEDGTFGFTVTADPAPSSELTFKYKVTAETGNTATAGTDFTEVATPTAGSIAANQTTTTITVTVVDDSIDETDETFTVTLSDPSTGVTISDGTAVGTIEDNDNPPSISIVAPAGAVTEGDSGNSNMVFAVTLSVASGKEVTVGYTVDATSTATSGTDHAALSSGTLTFVAGTTRKDIAVVVRGDEIDEVDETVVIKLTSPTNATLGTSTATGTIADDDNPPSISIAPPAGAVTEGDSGNSNMVFAVTLSAASGKEVMVVYAVDATSTATSGTDHTALSSGTLTFAAGTTRKDITVVVRGDEVDEVDETVVIKLTSPTNATLGTATATGTIADDDNPPSISIAAPAGAVTEGDSGNSNMVFAVTLSAISGKEVTVGYTVDATSTATSGTDHTALSSGTLTFAAGTTRKDITVVVRGDEVDEVDETVVIKLTSPTNATLGTSTATGTIADDDNPPSISIVAPAGAVTEGDSGNSNMVFAVTLSAISGKEVTVGYTVDATSTATSGTDHTALSSGTLTFAAGTTRKDITVVVRGDEVDEVDEAVVIKLTSPTNATLGTSTATGTIADDDNPPSISIVAPAGAVTEGDSGNSNMVFAVTLSAASGKEVMVGYAVDATSTATSGTDHTALSSGTLTFTAGTTRKDITVVVRGDEVDEVDETVVIKLTSPVNATLGTATATGTIADDDASPDLTTLSNVVVKVGEEVDITASATDGDADTVTYAWSRKASGSTLALPGGTVLNRAQLTFRPGATGTYTMVVTASDNKGNSDTEKVVITVSAATVVSVPRSVSVTEGTSTNAVVRITTGQAFGRSVTFNISYGGNAKGASNPSNGDYDNDAVTSVTFDGSDTTRDITIPITDDSVSEGDETFTVTIASTTLPDGFILGNSTTTVTIKDNDNPPSISIAAPAGAVTEGDSANSNMVFAVTLSVASGEEVTVGYAVDATSTATSGTDHTALSSGTLTFAAGTTRKDITVVVRGDEVDEVDETVVIKLTSPTNATLGTSTATGTIADDDASPDLTTLSNVVVKVGEEVDITASATDGDADTVTYAWSRKASGSTLALPGGTVLNRAQLTFRPGATGTYTMVVTASDNKGNSDTEEVVITVSAATVVSVPRSVSVTEGTSTNAVVRITTGQAFGRSVTFNISYGGNAKGASNPSNGDYDNDAVTSVTFDGSHTTRDITIPITDDSVSEGDETFTVTIASATLPDGFILGNSTTTVTIKDNESTRSTGGTPAATPTNPAGGGTRSTGGTPAATPTSPAGGGTRSTGGTPAATPTSPAGGSTRPTGGTPAATPTNPTGGGTRSTDEKTLDPVAPANPTNEDVSSAAGGCSISGERQVQASFLSDAFHFVVLLSFFLLALARKSNSRTSTWP